MIKKISLSLLLLIIFFVSCKKDEIKTDIINISILRDDSLNAEAIELGLKDEIALTNKNVIFTTFIANSSYTSFIEEASKINTKGSKTVIAIGQSALEAVTTIMPSQNIIFSTIKDNYYFQSNDNTTYSNRGVYYIPDISKFIEITANITKSKSIGYIYGVDERSIYMKNIISNICFENNIKYTGYDLNIITDFAAAIKYSRKPDMFIVTKDKTVMENLYTITKAAHDNFIPIVSTDIFSSENGGILLAVDINYYRIGRALATILNELLDGKKIENIYSIYLYGDNAFDILVNLDIAERLKIKLPESLKTNAKIIIENFNIKKPLQTIGD